MWKVPQLFQGLPNLPFMGEKALGAARAPECWLKSEGISLSVLICRTGQHLPHREGDVSPSQTSTSTMFVL